MKNIAQFERDAILRQPVSVHSAYQDDGVIYLKDFLQPETRQGILKEMDQAQRMAEASLQRDWNNEKIVFYSKNAVKSDEPQSDYSTQPYFQASRDRAHVFYEKIDEIDAVNRIGHGMHLLPECPLIQTMTYSNDVLSAALKIAGFIRPICHLSVYIPKFPNTVGSEVNPHQESTFANTEPASVVVLWVALEDALIENACMWGIPGSNKWPLQFISRVDHVNKTRHFERINQDVRFPDFRTERSAFTPLEVMAGDAILFHGNFVHCSPANDSTRSRKALSLQFIETHNVVYAKSNWLQPPNKEYIFDLSNSVRHGHDV